MSSHQQNVKELSASIVLHLVIASTTHNATMSMVTVLMTYAHLAGGVTTVALVCINVTSDFLFSFNSG